MDMFCASADVDTDSTSSGDGNSTASRDKLAKVPFLLKIEKDDEPETRIKVAKCANIAPLSYYLRHAFHVTDGPTSPTWAYYGGSTEQCENTAARAAIWIVLMFVGTCIFVIWLRIQATVLEFLCQMLLWYPTAHYVFHFVVLAAFPMPAKEDYHQNDPKYLVRIGCVIPCHKSADEIVHTVKSVLAFCKPEHVVVVDNGNSLNPLDDTEARLQELQPKVKYMWLPVGHKCNALWVGVNALPSTVEFVMHIDDDTVLPPDMVFDEKVWEHPKTAAVSYGISMFQRGQVERLVDFEFKLVSHYNHFLSKRSSVIFCYGIIGLWRKEAFRDRLHEHPFLPWGEDSWIGHINMLQNAQIRQEVRSFVSTYAPTTLLPFSGSRDQGYGAANVWKQRTQRWFCNQPRRFPHRLAALFSYRHDTCMGNVFFRFEILLHLMTTTMTLAIPLLAVLQCDRYGVVGYVALKAKFLGLVVAKGWLFCFLVNKVLWRHRPELQVSLPTMILMPFYHIFLVAAMVVGHWRCVLYYIPFIPMRHGLYSEGIMTKEFLKTYHNIEVADDNEEEDNVKLLGDEDRDTVLGI